MPRTKCPFGRRALKAKREHMSHVRSQKGTTKDFLDPNSVSLVDDSAHDSETPFDSDSSVAMDSTAYPLPANFLSTLNPPAPSQPSGRRILTIGCWLDSLNKVVNHGKVCPESNLVFQKETKVGLRTRAMVVCEACKWSDWLATDKEESEIGLPINESLVCGTNAGGTNFQAVKELFTIMELPYPSLVFYRKQQEKMKIQRDDALIKKLAENGIIEAEMARQANDFVAIDGKSYPCTSVHVDGGWCTRSYGHSFKSKGGIAVIIGARSQKLLFVEIKNMFCITCKSASNSNTAPPKHTCYKNWDENVSATVMESNIILEGFRASISMHGLVFKTLIADGDSSVYSTLQSSRVYPGISISKVECVNHVLKNLTKFVSNIVKDTKSYSREERLFLKKDIHRIGKSIRAAVIHRSKEKDTSKD